MLEALQNEAVAQVGGLMLGQICEVAKDSLTAMNYPEGDCAFCLHPLVERTSLPEEEVLQKLPCFHCFHL